MYTKIGFGALVATALAAPLVQDLGARQTSPEWQPASNSVVACDKDSDKIISFVVGPQLESVVNDACAAMLPVCAYPDRAPNGTVCTQIMDWKLDGAKNSTQHANVENAENGDKMSGWDVQFSVTPAQQTAEDSVGVFWTKDDCFGYFAYIANEQEPKGCHNGMGSQVGNLTVGGSTSLKDTVFDMKIVKRKSN